jgi:Fe-S cluster assembly iron-binding protein IscA
MGLFKNLLRMWSGSDQTNSAATAILSAPSTAGTFGSMGAPSTRAAMERKVVNVTEIAREKLISALANRITHYIRCSLDANERIGIVYDLRADNSPIMKSDFFDRSYGFLIVVDERSSRCLQGATIDWLTLPNGDAGFKFDNPLGNI